MSNQILKQLIYTSVSSRGLFEVISPDSLRRIRANNIAAEITGTLVWKDPKFMQVVEGPPDNINRLFSTLLKDDRHSDIVLISERIIHEREFPNWAMQSSSLDKDPVPKLSRHTELNNRASRILAAFARGSW